MNHLQQEQRILNARDRDLIRRDFELRRYSANTASPNAADIPVRRQTDNPTLRKPPSVETLPPDFAQYSTTEEIECQDCSGTGRDYGSLDPFCAEVCRHCAGSGREVITRNYLAEAFRIAADPGSTIEPKREHLVAVISHARQVVNAASEIDAKPKPPTVEQLRKALGVLDANLPEVA